MVAVLQVTCWLADLHIENKVWRWFGMRFHFVVVGVGGVVEPHVGNVDIQEEERWGRQGHQFLQMVWYSLCEVEF